MASLRMSRGYWRWGGRRHKDRVAEAKAVHGRARHHRTLEEVQTGRRWCLER